MIYITILNNCFINALWVILSITGANRHMEMSKIRTTFPVYVYFIEISSYS
jgi:hypothetical protein